MELPVYSSILPSPIGNLLLTATTRGLRSIWIMGEKHCPPILSTWDSNPRIFERAILQLNEYFAGTRQEFSLPLEIRGTPFQRSVWESLRGIPYGLTRTYGQQAEGLGNPRASRAVGTANGRNPLSIVIPCHRVIGGNGQLTGYGGGLAAKHWLLQHEQKYGGC